MSAFIADNPFVFYGGLLGACLLLMAVVLGLRLRRGDLTREVAAQSFGFLSVALFVVCGVFMSSLAMLFVFFVLPPSLQGQNVLRMAAFGGGAVGIAFFFRLRWYYRPKPSRGAVESS